MLIVNNFERCWVEERETIWSNTRSDDFGHDQSIFARRKISQCKHDRLVEQDERRVRRHRQISRHVRSTQYHFQFRSERRRESLSTWREISKTKRLGYFGILSRNLPERLVSERRRFGANARRGLVRVSNERWEEEENFMLDNFESYLKLIKSIKQWCNRKRRSFTYRKSTKLFVSSWLSN